MNTDQAQQLPAALQRFLDAYKDSNELLEIQYLKELKNRLTELTARINLGKITGNEDLTDQIYDINTKIQSQNGNTLFHLIIEKNQTDIINWMMCLQNSLIINFNMEAKNSLNETPLHIAIKNKNFLLVKKLIDAGINLQTNILIEEKSISYVEYARHHKAEFLARFLEDTLQQIEHSVACDWEAEFDEEESSDGNNSNRVNLSNGNTDSRKRNFASLSTSSSSSTSPQLNSEYAQYVAKRRRTISDQGSIGYNPAFIGNSANSTPEQTHQRATQPASPNMSFLEPESNQNGEYQSQF